VIESMDMVDYTLTMEANIREIFNMTKLKDLEHTLIKITAVLVKCGRMNFSSIELYLLIISL
jgi:hypothetical protein